MSFRTAVLPLFLVSGLGLLGGCAASEAQSESSSNASEVVTAPRPDQQVFDRISKAEKDATIDAFLAQNPSFVLDRRYAEVNDLTGGLESITNETPLGPRVTQTAADVVAKATAFLEKNAELFALTTADIATADVAAKPYPFESGNSPWTVTFRRVTSPAGYEGFDTVVRNVAVGIDFRKDGTIGRAYSSTSFFPDLRVSTTPALAEDAPAVTANVVGTDLVWHDPSFLPGPDENVGRVTASDVTAKAPVLHLAHGANAVTLTLAYQVDVSRGGHDWTFFVHSRTGEVLERTQRDF